MVLKARTTIKTSHVLLNMIAPSVHSSFVGGMQFLDLRLDNWVFYFVK